LAGCQDHGGCEDQKANGFDAKHDLLSIRDVADADTI
jgi:hypothetical protein